jgi:hypothetical protein
VSRVLVACEFSGIVRDAFAARGHDAWSCDLLPSERRGNHLIGDVREFLGGVFGRPWELMIAHPPCTYLSFASRPIWNTPGRAEKRVEAMEFFMQLWNAPINRVCLENPLGVPNTEFRRPDQIINPFNFGHPERKRTCLWLRGLPPLMHTLETTPERPDKVNHRGRGEYWHHRKKRDGHSRSRTFPGIATAMADQWSPLLEGRAAA